MDKNYDHTKESEIYDLWEKSGAFSPTPITNHRSPFTIIMPPPNANASLHAGHAMYTVDDILIRFKRMQGFSALWIPGIDHAGFETQFVYEKVLAKEGKSRMDFDRQTLYRNIFEFVEKNSGLIFEQFKRLGFSADWDRSIASWDKDVVNFVYQTFKKMEKEGLVYRDNYIVNYCTHCGTSLAELEVKHLERKDPLYYIKYGPFVLATVRPETKFGDTAVAIHPKDKRYKDWVGKEIEVDGLLGKFKLRVIADEYVDPQFGTGVVKVTPAHDPNDFEMGKRHNLETKQIIDLNGKLTDLTGPYAGLKVKVAREKVVEDLKKKGLIEKIDENYLHSVTVCYKCGHDLEPSIMPNWFIKVEGLKEKVKKAVIDSNVRFYPGRYKKHMLNWLEIMHDWPISRQIVWCIRIPVWYRVDPTAANIWVWWIDKNKKLQQGNISQFINKGACLEEIENGLQKVYALTGKDQPDYVVSDKKPDDGNLYLPETDTFDTWFSSGQWPLVTIKEDEISSRYPSDLMGTLSDILKFWISRMMMFSLYLTNKVPFKNVYLWSMVADSKGIKMSKSKGNVVNPVELIDKYGADALRMSLLYGTPAGSKVILSDDKVRAMRNFSNKLWNIARYIQMVYENTPATLNKPKELNSEDEKLLGQLNVLIKSVTGSLESYKLNIAIEDLYEFAWHNFADKYIESTKDKARNKDVSTLYSLKYTYTTLLKLLHPFAPFVTEKIWQETKLGSPKELLINSSWPKI